MNTFEAVRSRTVWRAFGIGGEGGLGRRQGAGERDHTRPTRKPSSNEPHAMTQPTADVCERWNAGGTVRRPPMTTANAVNASVSVDAGADCAAHQPTGSSRLATQRYANDSH